MSSLDQPEPSALTALQQAAGAFRALGEALDVLAAGIAEREGAPTTGPDELLTISEAARELRRSRAFVRAQCRSGAIKALRDGHGWRVRRSALVS